MFNYYSLSVTVTFVFKVNLNKFENWYKNEMKKFSFFVDLLRFKKKQLKPIIIKYELHLWE